METLRGKVAVVTGAASGIGFALAQGFVSHGMSVVCADVDGLALEEVAASFEKARGEVAIVTTDVSDPDAVDALRDETFSRFGTAHVVCNNAGIPAFQRMTSSIDLERWRRTVDVNLFGVIHGVRAFLPRLLEQDEGHIVNTASRQGLLGSASAGAYATSKFGIVGLSEVLDAELRDLGSRVGVSVVCPGAVATNLMRHGRDNGMQREVSDELSQRVQGKIEPVVVADLVVKAIVEGCLYVNSHADTIEMLASRHRRIVEDAERLGIARGR